MANTIRAMKPCACCKQLFRFDEDSELPELYEGPNGKLYCQHCYDDEFNYADFALAYSVEKAMLAADTYIHAVNHCNRQFKLDKNSDQFAQAIRLLIEARRAFLVAGADEQWLRDIWDAARSAEQRPTWFMLRMQPGMPPSAYQEGVPS